MVKKSAKRKTLTLKRSKKKSAWPPKLINPFRCLGASLSFASRFRSRLLPILVVAIIFNLIFGFNNAQSTNLLLTIWFVYTSCALIWTIRHANDKSTAYSLGRAYYIGTAPNLRLMLSLFLLILTTLPLLFGTFVYSKVISLSGSGGWAEPAVAGIFLLVAALLTLFLLVRSVFSLLIVTLPDITPIVALKLSWKLSHGRTIALAWHWLVFFVILLFLLLAMGFLISALPANLRLADFVAELISTGLILPVAYIYLFLLYQNLTNLSTKSEAKKLGNL